MSFKTIHSVLDTSWPLSCDAIRLVEQTNYFLQCDLFLLDDGISSENAKKTVPSPFFFSSFMILLLERRWTKEKADSFNIEQKKRKANKHILSFCTSLAIIIHMGYSFLYYYSSICRLRRYQSLPNIQML
jgi:hypothetical protein